MYYVNLKIKIIVDLSVFFPASVPNAFQSQTSTSEQLQAVANANSTAGEQTEGKISVAN